MKYKLISNTKEDGGSINDTDFEVRINEFLKTVDKVVMVIHNDYEFDSLFFRDCHIYYEVK